MNKYFIRSLAVLSFVLIVGGFGFLFFQGRAFGAWGDDSPGYIYQATLLYANKPVVYYSELADVAFDYFEKPGDVRFVLPRHHRPLNRDGMIASKYPLGAGILMAGLGNIFQSESAFYLLVPLSTTAALGLIFILTYLILDKYKVSVRVLSASLAAILLGVSNLFYEYAFSQPMRDIPSLVFILGAFVLLVIAKKYRKVMWPLILVAGLSYGMSLNIRHTGIVVAPAFVIFLLSFFPKITREIWRPIVKMAVGFFLFVGVALIPTFINSYQISQHKISFETDTSEVVIASNVDHLESLGLENLFDNQGKFRPGEGALPHYWKILNRFSTLPLLMVFVLIGIISLAKKDKSATISFLWAGASIFGLFSLWINPYSRYILPTFPFVALFAGLGIVVGLGYWLKVAPNSKTKAVGIVLAVGTIFFLLSPSLDRIVEDFREPPLVNKALSREDFSTLKKIPGILNSNNPFLIMTGNWMFGLGEMIEGHDGIPHLRIPREGISLNEVSPFIEAEVFPRYDAFVWMDSSTRLETREEIIENWDLELVGSQTYSFELKAEIYAIRGTIN